MKQLEKLRLAQNVGSGWLGIVVNVLTGLLVSPYIVHRLGDEAFGLWVLVFSFIGYYGIFNLGIRTSVVRYVARYSAVGDHEQLNQVVNTSLAVYSVICLLALGVTGIGSLFIPRIVHFDSGFRHQATVLFLLVGSSIALSFPLSVFAGILEGLQKFYLTNLVNICSTVMRAILVIAALRNGYGLLTVALITVLLPFANQAVNAWNALRSVPLRFHLRFVRADTLKQLLNYGWASLVINVAGNLRFRTDEIVIGSVLSATAITPFAIGARILDYGAALIDSIAQVFTPMSSHLDAKGEELSLRSIFILGNRTCALVMFPMCIGLIILGKGVIAVWMGPRYLAMSYPVLLVLLIGYTLRLSQATTQRILSGIARHKYMAMALFAEGVANLLLSIVLTRKYGIVGCALGTSLPMLITYTFFLPGHICRLLGIRVRTFLIDAYALPGLLCIPMAAVLLLMKSRLPADTLPSLLGQVALGSTIYLGFFYYAFKSRSLKLWDLRERALNASDNQSLSVLQELTDEGEAISPSNGTFRDS